VGIMSATLLHGTEFTLKGLLLKHNELCQKLETEVLCVEELSAYEVMGCKITLKITLNILD
jgi:hypothetical protein